MKLIFLKYLGGLFDMKETLWGEEHQETAFRFKYESPFLLLKVFLQKKFYPSFFYIDMKSMMSILNFFDFFSGIKKLLLALVYIFFIFFYFTYQNFVYFRYAVERVNLDKRILKRWEDLKL